MVIDAVVVRRPGDPNAGLKMIEMLQEAPTTQHQRVSPVLATATDAVGVGPRGCRLPGSGTLWATNRPAEQNAGDPPFPALARKVSLPGSGSAGNHAS